MIAYRTHTPGPRERAGLSSAEIIVAFTLLSALLGISTSLLVKHGRMLKAQQQYRIALDELSNQFEMLSTLPEAELEQTVEHLKPSAFAAKRLPGAQITGELAPADFGRRLRLRIWWDEPQRSQAPVSLAAWLTPASERQEAAAEGDPS